MGFSIVGLSEGTKSNWFLANNLRSTCSNVCVGARFHVVSAFTRNWFPFSKLKIANNYLAAMYINNKILRSRWAIR